MAAAALECPASSNHGGEGQQTPHVGAEVQQPSMPKHGSEESVVGGDGWHVDEVIQHSGDKAERKYARVKTGGGEEELAGLRRREDPPQVVW